MALGLVLGPRPKEPDSLRPWKAKAKKALGLGPGPGVWALAAFFQDPKKRVWYRAQVSDATGAGELSSA